MEEIVVLSDVRKRFGEVEALRGLTLNLAPGRIGLLGPNGAGKSTFIRTLLGITRPDSGTARVLGRDVQTDAAAIRAFVGYMPEGDAVMPDLTAYEYTLLAGELCGLPRKEAMGRAHQILHYVGLGEARYRKMGSFSTGMRQRARLAQALVGDPKLLLLDEPTSGLDPRGREEMLALIWDIPSRTGASVLLSTHLLPDVERTCEQVVVIAAGEVRYAGPMAAFVQGGANTLEVRFKGGASALCEGLRLAGCTVKEDAARLFVDLPAGAANELVFKVAAERGVQVRHLAPLKYTLEDAFFKSVGAA